MAGELTTLEKAKKHLRIETGDTSADDALAELVTSQSRLFKSKVNRDLLYRKYVETRDGNGKPGIDTWQYPLQSVDSVVIDGSTVPVAPALVAGQNVQYGYVRSADRIEIRRGETTDSYPKFCFTRGQSNVVLTYWAGFLLVDEAATIPGTSPYQVQSQEAFVGDPGNPAVPGVKFSPSGTALTKVASSPAAGQYSVDSSGLYTFHSADAGKDILLTYAYIPADIVQAVNEMIAWRYHEADRLGQRSKSISGEFVWFDNSAVPPSVEAVIDFYKRWQV